MFSPNVDCFGRDKHADYRDDMGGVGSFMRQNLTIYVGRIHVTDDIEETVALGTAVEGKDVAAAERTGIDLERLTRVDVGIVSLEPIAVTGAKRQDFHMRKRRRLESVLRRRVVAVQGDKIGACAAIERQGQVAGWFMELRALAFDSAFVLPLRQRHHGREGDAPMEATSLNAALNRLRDKLGDRCRRFTPHDLRSTARSHLGALGVDVLIAERCLNHSLGGLVAVYDKHDYVAERRKALELWSAKITALEKDEAFNVLPFKRVASN
jgi:hypothetical protein